MADFGGRKKQIQSQMFATTKRQHLALDLRWSIDQSRLP